MESIPHISNRRPCFGVRLCAEFKRLAMLVVVGGLLFIAGKHYWFDRLNEEIRLHVENLLRAHYQGLSVSVKSARRIAGRGVEIRGVRIAEAGGRDAPVLADIDEIFAECDTRLPDFLTKPPRISSLRVQRLKLRAERKPNGFWNLSHLLPLPPCKGARPPSATIADGELEIVDPQGRNGATCSWTLRNMELTVEPKAGKESEGVLLQVRGRLAGDHLERVEIDGRLDPATNEWELRGTVAGLEFSPRLRAALPRELSHAAAPLSSIRGRTYFGFEVRHVSAGSPTLQFAVQGKISEGRIDDARLPEPLTDVEATVRCDNHGIVIEDLSARSGASRIELDASIHGFDGRQSIEIDLIARQLQLERLPIGPLPRQVRETWDRFQPHGLADVSGRLSFDGQTWHPDLKIECRDLSLTYHRFPYRLTDGGGTITAGPEVISARLALLGGGRLVHCHADVRHPGPNFTGSIDIFSEGAVAIDEELLAAMEPAKQQLVRSFRPRGNAAFRTRYWRDPGQVAVQRSLHIELQDASICHVRFPYPIDRVSGVLEMTGENWVFRNLVGRNDSAVINGEGSWVSGGTQAGELNLRFTASDVPLAEELRQALSPGAQRLWTGISPHGNLDQVVVGLKYVAPARRWSVEVQADKWPATLPGGGRSISLEPAALPCRFDSLTGSFHYLDGNMALKNLRAVRGRSVVTAEGSCHVLPGGGYRLELGRLAADRVEFDQELLAALPAGLARSLGRIQLQAPLNVQGSVGVIMPPQSDLPPRLDWDLSVDVENGRAVFSKPLEHIHGEVRLIGSHGNQGTFTRGDLNIDSLICGGAQVTGIQGPFFVDGKRLVFGSAAERDVVGRLPREMTGKVCGGVFSLLGELALDDGAFQARAAMENADLAELARQLGPQWPTLSGRFDGIVNVGGRAEAVHTWRGDGHARLRDADIYELPLMIALLSLLSVKQPERTAFTNSTIDFRIEGDDLALDRIDFSGDAVSLKGQGRIDSQRQVDLKFYPILGREEWQLPIFRPLLGKTGQEFMLIEVAGTLDQPHVNPIILPRIDAQLQQLFPELASSELEVSNFPIISLPREALQWLRLAPRK